MRNPTYNMRHARKITNQKKDHNSYSQKKPLSRRVPLSLLVPLQLGALSDGTNLEVLAVLLQDALVMILPEGLGGVLAGPALEDLCAARVLLQELYARVSMYFTGGMSSTLMIRGSAQMVDILVTS